MSQVDPRQLLLPLDQIEPDLKPDPGSKAQAILKFFRLTKPQGPVLSDPKPEAGKKVVPGASRRFQMDGHTVDYVLRRSKRHSIGFLINDDGLRVTAPRWVTISAIEDAIRDKRRWILTKLDQRSERLARSVSQPLEWGEGTELPYLGRTITLRLGAYATGNSSLDALNGDLSVALPTDATAQQVRECVMKWMQTDAKRLFAERMPLYADRLSVSYRSCELSSAIRRWGSCSTSGKIRLNWRLIHFPLALIDYVIAHELAHLREMNHSARFWAAVESVFPDHAKARKSLREQAPAIFSLF
jgi:hypothetical protein